MQDIQDALDIEEKTLRQAQITVSKQLTRLQLDEKLLTLVLNKTKKPSNAAAQKNVK
jgi:hypothetical protein